DLPAEGTSTQIFWMDLWTGPDAPVRRIKVEPEVKVESDWVTYPMEVRVVDAVVPGAATTAVSIRAMLCGAPQPASSTDRDRMHIRNSQQDVALSTRASPDVIRRLAACDTPEPADPEWYFRIRDYLFRMR
ncbi:MAG: hypothetical protein LAO79_26215, partial [Acidobacteriia bacterium]|nr:hypothetical protein [Terriglobia bacterium]